ncbi:MAG: MFS transporter [Bryobacteraceae bacterium]
MPGNLDTKIGPPQRDPARQVARKTVYSILIAISFCHLLNDMVQSMIPAIYPLLKAGFHLDFGQVGLITLTFQMTASLLQPVVGSYTDRRPMSYSLSIGMGFTLIGLITLSRAPTFGVLLIAAALVGMGSSVFHPESSRVARTASGGQPGLAQSLFQVGGNAGTAIGPLLAALIVLPKGQSSIVWFSAAALIGMFVLARVGSWSKSHARAKARSRASEHPHSALPKKAVKKSVAILIALVFSKYFYLASLGSYYTFYLMTRFHVSVASSQIHLFIFLGSVAAGTLIGGPIGDRIGRKYVIWWSILGVLPFTLALPRVDLFWTTILSIAIGVILSSAFPAILVYAQDLLPGKIGMISGLFFGLAFGMAGIGAAVLGELADWKGIYFVYEICAYLPAIGLIAGFLPNLEREQA